MIVEFVHHKRLTMEEIKVRFGEPTGATAPSDGQAFKPGRTRRPLPRCQRDLPHPFPYPGKEPLLPSSSDVRRS